MMYQRFKSLLIALVFVISSCKQASPVFPVVHISYDTPIEGFTVSFDWYPTEDYSIVPGDSVYITWGRAEIVLHNNQTKKDISLSSDGITVPEWVFTQRILKAEESMVLHYEPFRSEDEVIPPGNDQIVFFADVDFDGEKELIINSFKGGAQWANTYTAYNLTNNGAELIDYPPFFGIEERFEDYRVIFHPENKAVEGIYGNGINQYSKVYKFDGSGGIPVCITSNQ